MWALIVYHTLVTGLVLNLQFFETQAECEAQVTPHSVCEYVP